MIDFVLVRFLKIVGWSHVCLRGTRSVCGCNITCTTA